MAILKKNIWTIFYILCGTAFLFLCIISWNKWNSTHQKYAIDQINLVKLVSNATHSLFLSQEMMLTTLGHHIVKDHDPRIFDDLLILNPSIVAFGFVDVEGNYLYTSSNFDKSKRPNLREQAVSRESFDYTLTQEKMVLGKTYFIAASGRWGIPIRKTVFDEITKKPLGVMTAGLGIEGAFKIYTDNVSLGDFNKITLIRDKDQFVQFQSSNDELSKKLFDAPIADQFLEKLLKRVMKKYDISHDKLKLSRDIYTIESFDTKEGTIQSVLKYDPRYELWIVSEVNHSQIIQDFTKSFLSYIFIFVVVHIILFFLFKIISNAEEERKQDLIFQATHDTLTQLPNRSYLYQFIHRWIYEGAPPFSLYYLDMDHFKNVNDSFGHHYGDLLLIEFSKRVSHLIRQDSVLIRQGGDEFILLTYRTDMEEILAHSNTILQEISRPYQIKQFSFVIGASIGIAKFPEHGNTLDMLLRASDIAMYEAKKYKNSVRIFSPSMQEGYLKRVNVEQALHKAFDNHELFMVYQPQIDHKGNIYGVEALVRWQSQELGSVPPDQFIPVAEASGLMPRLGHFITHTTLHEMKQLQEELGISFQTSINISVKQFMEADFLDTLAHKINHVKLDYISLCLEITESLFIEDIDYILPLLKDIRTLGLSISMDDFGTGYSSLSILRKLPIDELKIDKSFVDALLSDITAEKMVQNIIMIGKNLDLHILAEGVETIEQEAVLKKLGCDRFQGYLYAKPLRYEDLKRFLHEKKNHFA